MSQCLSAEGLIEDAFITCSYGDRTASFSGHPSSRLQSKDVTFFLMYRSFSLSRNENINWKLSCGGGQEDEML